ncbi:MAG: DoxX family protein [Salinarchaeum sp.]
MSDDETTATSQSTLARVVFGLGLALQAAEAFRDMETTISYAEHAGVPKPDVMAPFATGMMVAGGIGIALWRLPKLATGAAATFLVAVTPTMHDFWNAENRDEERLSFLTNAALLGGVLSYLRRAYD